MSEKRSVMYFGHRIPEDIYEDYEKAKEILEELYKSESARVNEEEVIQFLVKMTKKLDNMRNL